MSGTNSNPPKFAIWCLRHACFGRDNDALTGDLIERFHEGQTRAWFWKQALIAFAVAVLGEVRRHWPHISYATAGTITLCLFRDADALKGVPGWLHWGVLPRPWSQLAFELSRPALLSLATLPVLAAGLLRERSFRWVNLFSTAIVNLALVTLAHFAVDYCPWLRRPVIGYPHYTWVPPSVQLPLLFLPFLLAAWLCCPSPLPPAHPSEA